MMSWIKVYVLGESNRAVGLTGGPTRLSRGSSISSLGDMRICIRIAAVKIKGNQFVSKAHLFVEEVVWAGQKLLIYQ